MEHVVGTNHLDEDVQDEIKVWSALRVGTLVTRGRLSWRCCFDQPRPFLVEIRVASVVG
jgi:hypothetical protein